MIEELFTQISESPEIQAYIQNRRVGVFKQIHEIVFYGKGGYDYEAVYHMPIWLRRYTLHELNEHYEKEAAALSGKKVSTVSSQQPVIQRPAIRTPDFVINANKKPGP